MEKGYGGGEFESQLHQDVSVLRIAEGRERLAAKLEEYKSRYKKYQAPEVQFDTIYKTEITRRLVETGEVNTDELYEELETKYGMVDAYQFQNAVSVIRDYIETGGKNVVNGTGLPQMEAPESEEELN